MAWLSALRGSNEDCYAMQKWARVALKTNNIDTAPASATGRRWPGSPSRLVPVRQPTRLRMSLNSNLIVMWGSNAVEAHPLAGRRIMVRPRRGACPSS